MRTELTSKVHAVYDCIIFYQDGFVVYGRSDEQMNKVCTRPVKLDTFILTENLVVKLNASTLTVCSFDRPSEELWLASQAHSLHQSLGNVWDV